jgi:hypothetical protein
VCRCFRATRRVGQNDGDATNYPNYYQAAVFCRICGDWLFYDNVLTFSVDGGALKYKLDNGGSTFSQFLQNVGGGTVGGDDACLLQHRRT